MPAGKRRRLPARVYWFRRTAVLVTVLALAFAVGRLVVRHGDDAVAAARASPSTTPAGTPTSDPTTGASPGVSAPTPTGSATPTASASPTLSAPTSVPTGACSDDQVTAAPAVTQVTGGQNVALTLDLTTTTSGACTWRVSSASLVVKISKGSNRIWSSQDCSSSVTAQDVVVRPADEQPTQVQVSWGGRRSVTGCTAGQAWVDPGTYLLTAASLGGEPKQARFAVVAPPQPVVTKTAKPKKQKTPAAPTTTPPG